MSKYLSDRFSGLKEYIPGEQPRDRSYIKLNTNESPYPPSPSVLESVAEEADLLNLYSDPDCTALTEKFASLYGVKPSNVVFGNGSDEILNFCFMAFCDKNKGMAFPSISYGFYSVFAELYGIDYTAIELDDDFCIDINDYMNLDKNIVIANPNAPTGIALSLDSIEAIVKSNINNVVIIDEAYVDYGADSAVSLIDKYDNLIVVGTFSKSRSLAGARLGFAFANEELIRDLHKIRYSTNPYNINRLTLKAGESAIDENDYYMDNCKEIIATREKTAEELKSLGFSVLPSKTNFLFAKYSGDLGGKELYLKLKDEGILVRHFDKERINDYLRITIGTPEQMETFIQKLSKIINQ